MNPLAKLSLTVAFVAFINSNTAFALTSNGSDGALVVNNSLTLTTINNQTFNYTTINLGAGSILDFSGINSGDSVFILGTEDFSLDGMINLPSLTSFTFETTGNIYLNGSIVSSHSNISLVSQNFVSYVNSLISDTGGRISIAANTATINGHIDVGGTLVTPDPSTPFVLLPLNPSPITVVPEPASCSLLVVGLGLIGFVLRRKQS